jgi:hypothetical protein
MNAEEHRLSRAAMANPLTAAEEDGLGGYAYRCAAYRNNGHPTAAEAARSALALALQRQFGAYAAAVTLADSFP